MQLPVAEAFSVHVRRNPAAPVAWTAGGLRDRAELDALALRLGRCMAQVPRGSRVAISVRDGFTFLAAVLAVWRHGACAVMLDAADPRAPRTDLARRFGAAGLLLDEPELRCAMLGGGDPAGDFAAIKLTSGSTEEPRGIGVGTAELLADCDALRQSMGIGDDDRVFAAVPMSFSYGIGSVLVPALWHGQPLVLPDHRHPLGFLQAIQRGRPTVLPAVPALLRGLLAGRADLGTSLRLCISAGAVLPPATAVAFRERFGLPVHAFYGATETGGICYDRTGRCAENGAVGTPVEGVEVSLDPCGRVVVRSPAVGRPLAPDPDFHDGAFTTSDLGAFCSGDLVLQGRTNDVFDVGGHKVHPREVERVIAAIGGVDEVAVVPWQDTDGRAGCVALVVGSGVDESAVRRQCVAQLPAAKVPRRIVFLRALPCTSRGKLARDMVERLLRGEDVGGTAGRNA